MKKIFFTTSCLVSLWSYGQGTFRTEAGTRIVTEPQTRLVMDNLHFFNNSETPHVNGVLRLTGNQTTQLNGTFPLQVFALELDKSGGAETSLQKDITVQDIIRFYGGNLNLGNSIVQLSPAAKLWGEQETRRAYTTGNGYLIITVNMNAPSLSNAGNLGAFITSPANLGAVTVKRGHMPQTGSGLSGSIRRYYEITPANNTNLNATLELLYFDAELNSQNESTLSLFQRVNGGANWTSLGADQKSVTDNFIRKTSLTSLYHYTLSSALYAPLPVTGIEFFARRINPQQVQLDWKTIQEFNNKGFHVERMKQDEPNYTAISFHPSKDFDGNSTVPLSYQLTDQNSFAGRTSYRLQQEDKDGNFTYSTVQIVNGQKGKLVNLTIYPNPAPKEFSIMAEGIENDKLQVYDISGRLRFESVIIGTNAIKIGHLPAGAYIIRVAGEPDVVQKVVVQ